MTTELEPKCAYNVEGCDCQRPAAVSLINEQGVKAGNPYCWNHGKDILKFWRETNGVEGSWRLQDVG